VEKVHFAVFDGAVLATARGALSGIFFEHSAIVGVAHQHTIPGCTSLDTFFVLGVVLIVIFIPVLHKHILQIAVLVCCVVGRRDGLVHRLRRSEFSAF
jgi:hypothetical protein